MLVAAIYDRVHIKYRMQKGKFLLWFSPQRNARKVLQVTADGATEDPNQSQLNCLHGVRALTIIFVIVGHTLAWNDFNIFRTIFSIRDRFADIWPHFIFRMQLSVDTFFLMR